MSRRRVVVTGLGLVTPVGNTVEQAWANLLAGQSGIDTITKFDPSGLSVHFAGEVKGFNIEDYIPAKEARHMDVFIHYGLAAALQAVKDAGLPTGDALSPEQAERIGCLVSSGIGGLPMIEQTHKDYTERGARRISPFFVPASIINMISGHLSIYCGFKGPNLSVVTACTTGLHSIGQAARMIQYGDADVMVAGGAESTVSPLGVGGFAAARALSSRNDDPKTASRPWDKDRDGFVLGEGAALLFIEKESSARARGATVVGYDRYNEDAMSIARDLADREGRTFIPPFDHADVLCGQGTAAMELFEEVGELDVLLVCLGGGGLLSGCALSARALSPHCRVYGVEPEAGNDVQQSFRQGKRVRIPTPRTIADGAQSPQVGELTFEIIRRQSEQIDQLIAENKALKERLDKIEEALAAAPAQAPAKKGRKLASGTVRRVLARYFFEVTERKPVILPVVMEV